MIGLALRFDLYMYYLKKQENGAKKAPYVSVTGRWGDKFWTSGLPDELLPIHLRTSFPKPYFTASLIGYVTGMVVTLGIMTVFHHAQPALLYLVPGVLLSLWGTALVRGDLKQMWNYTEAVTAEQMGHDEKPEGEKAKEGSESNPKGIFERFWHELWHGEDKKTGEDKAKESNSVKSKKQRNKAATTKENDDDGDSGVLFLFSVSRFDPRSSSSKTKTVKQEDKADLKLQKADSAADSESSEDAVIVSSGDLDGTQTDTMPRYRTRSAKAVAS